MGSNYDRVATARRAPNDDPPETHDEAVASLAAAFLDLLGLDAVKHTQPSDLARDLDRRFPGFREWWEGNESWGIAENCNAAWQIAYESDREMEFSEIVSHDGLIR